MTRYEDIDAYVDKRGRLKKPGRPSSLSCDDGLGCVYKGSITCKRCLRHDLYEEKTKLGQITYNSGFGKDKYGSVVKGGFSDDDSRAD